MIMITSLHFNVITIIVNSAVILMLSFVVVMTECRDDDNGDND